MIEIEINGKISCVYGLEELVLLKCPYKPMQCTDSVHSREMSDNRMILCRIGAG
jgi:hypothetical protein